MLSIATTVTVGTSTDYENVAFAPEEIATLSSLMKRYDQVILDLDSLNDRLQELLDIESPPPPKNSTCTIHFAFACGTPKAQRGRGPEY